MIALTIDCEQWNCPLLEGKKTEENNNTSFSKSGNEALMDLFARHNVKATFFVTGYFAEKEPKQVKAIKEKGHEIACHGYNHFYRGNKNLNIKQDIINAKEILEKITGKSINGFRAPQMQYSEKLIEILDDLNFKYDSSLHPCWLPGYYNNLDKPTKIFKPLKNKDIIEIPASVSSLRLPISWLFIRLFGINRTISACKSLLKKNITPVLYFHSWEFIKMESKFVPFYYNFRTGKPFVKDIERFIRYFENVSFITIENLIDNYGL
ncbi:MAG: PEP-CTERM locus polysaccharide deactylase [Parcubacteria group bacterium Licking1014_1]|nr:MAG: PEP-CTERM locus polysaccharide deactylase [Parcubacteria group bacterium Licking1014_1]